MATASVCASWFQTEIILYLNKKNKNLFYSQKKYFQYRWWIIQLGAKQSSGKRSMTPLSLRGITRMHLPITTHIVCNHRSQKSVNLGFNFYMGFNTISFLFLNCYLFTDFCVRHTLSMHSVELIWVHCFFIKRLQTGDNCSFITTCTQEINGNKGSTVIAP